MKFRKCLLAFSFLFLISASVVAQPGGGPGGGGGSGDEITGVSGSGSSLTVNYTCGTNYSTNGFDWFLRVEKDGGGNVCTASLSSSDVTATTHSVAVDLGALGNFQPGESGDIIICVAYDGVFYRMIMHAFYADATTGAFTLSGSPYLLESQIPWLFPVYDGVLVQECSDCNGAVPAQNAVGPTGSDMNARLAIYSPGMYWSGGGGGGPSCSSGCGGGAPGAGGGTCMGGPFELAIRSRFDRASLPSLAGLGFFIDGIDVFGRVYESGNGSDMAVHFNGLPYVNLAINCEQESGDGTGEITDQLGALKGIVLKNGSTATDDVSAATKMEVTYFNGLALEFAAVDTAEGSDLEKDLRLTKIISPQGRETALTYTGATGRKINTLTDSHGNVYTFTFGSDIAGRETVSSIELPNGEDVTFAYTSDKLTEISTNNWEWSAAVSVNTTTQTIDYLVTDPVQGEREYHLTQDYFLLDDELLNQPANVCRSIYSGTRNIISFFPNPSDYTEVRVLRGTDQLSVCQYGQSEKFASSFTIGDIEDGYDAFTGITWESSYQYKDYGWGASYDDQDYRLGAAETMVGSDGYSVDYTYDSDFYVTEATYDDSTTEEFTYDSNKNLTRQKDRMDRVVKYVYDSQNNVTEKKVGILEVSGSDVNQSEYAVYEYDYYASGHANEFLLKTEYGPRHTSETDLYRTDYEYDSNDRMTKKTESADVASGTRPEWSYAYNGNGQLSSSDDPLDRTTTFIYNDSGQMTQATYEDGSTDQYFYDSTADLSGRVKYFKDRVDVVRYTEYNDDGKVAKVTSNYGTDTNVLDGAVATVETDATQKSISINAYDSVSGLLDYSLSDGDRTEYTYDYRRRTTQTRRYVASGVYRDAKTVYDSDHRVFYTEDHWGRRSYNGYRASDGALVRTIQSAHDGITYANNAAVMAATRVDGLNDTSIIADAILNDAGEVTDIYDARGIQTTVVFNSRGQVTTRTEAVGETVERKTETDYDVAGNATEVRHPRYFDSGDSNGYQKCKTVNTYNGRGLLASTVAASGSPVAATTSYTYHLDGKQATRTDPRGKIWSTDYHNCCGRFLGSENPLGHGTLSNTDYLGRVTHSITVEDYDDHTSNSHNPVDAKTMGERTVRYDGLGRTVASTQWLVAQGTVDENDPQIAGFDSVSASGGLTGQVIYDNNLADGIGLDNATGLTVDKMGGGTFSVSLSDCLTQLAETFANGGGNLSFSSNYATGSAYVSISPEYNISVSIQDGAGQTVMTALIESFNGSSPNDLITWSCSRANYSEVSESGFGNVATSYSIDALGNTTISRADGAGRILSTTDAESNISTMKYDANGQVKESRDPNGVGFDAVYDELGQLVSRTDTYGDAFSYGYDENGNKLILTDAKSEVTTYLHDALNRKIKTTDRLGGETEYAFDLNGNLTSITDAEDKVTEYEFDDAGQKTLERYPDHVNGTSAGDQHYGIIEFTFDPAGRLQRRTDRKGDTCTFNYDLASRLTSKDYRLRVNSPAGTITDSDSYTFDAASRMLTAVSGRYANTVTKTYDPAGRLEDESLTMGSGVSEKTYTVGREYDDRSQLWKLTYPDTTVVERTYTDRGQLYTVKYGATTVDTRTYDVGGRLSTSTYGNGVVTTYGYRNDTGDKDNQMDSIGIVKSATTIDAFDYTYDANKNVTSESRTGTMSNYGWDTDDSGSSGYDDDDRLTYWERDDSNLTQEWSLSLVGDWNSITENTVATTHTHNDVHELTDVGSNSLSYDANGNMTTNHNGDDYSWDFDNRMTGADTDVTAGDDVTFEYDALGRRVRKDDGTNDVVYVHAGQQVIAEYDFGTAASSPTEQYAYGEYIDEPIIKDGTMSSGTGIVYYHHDRRFSVVALTNATGSAVERYAYNPHGEMSVFNGSGTSISGSDYANTITFTGRNWNDETELYYFRAREFDPKIGGFISRDPKHYAEGFSLYRGYFGLSGVDPFGMQSNAPARQSITGYASELNSKNQCPQGWFVVGSGPRRIFNTVSGNPFTVPWDSGVAFWGDKWGWETVITNYNPKKWPGRVRVLWIHKYLKKGDVIQPVTDMVEPLASKGRSSLTTLHTRKYGRCGSGLSDRFRFQLMDQRRFNFKFYSSTWTVKWSTKIDGYRSVAPQEIDGGPRKRPGSTNVALPVTSPAIPGHRLMAILFLQEWGMQINGVAVPEVALWNASPTYSVCAQKCEKCEMRGW